MSLVEKEAIYEVAENQKTGEVALMFSARKGEPESPKLIYDGKENFMLFRQPGFSILFENSGKKIASKLKGVDQVLIAEFEDNTPIRKYNVRIRKMKRLPK